MRGRFLLNFLGKLKIKILKIFNFCYHYFVSKEIKDINHSNKNTRIGKMLTSDILQDRIKNFWGYGSLDAKVWFVGMEEGLGPTVDTELEYDMRGVTENQW